MIDFLTSSVFFSMALALSTFQLGLLLQRKFKMALCNPLIVAIVLCIVVLKCTGVPYDSFYQGTQMLSYLLTPATVCLSIGLYEQLSLLKKNALAILCGVLAGVLTSAATIYLGAVLFGLNRMQYATLLPKSITTAIGLGLSAELGGMATITVAAIMITGIGGNILAPTLCKLLHITEPVAKGIAIGTASHAVGTAKALELGEVEGAMSGLSIAVAGLMTVVVASFFVQFIG